MVDKIQNVSTTTYETFNDAVNQCFFDGRYAHTPVHLDLEDPIKEELSEKLGCDLESVEEFAGKAAAQSLNLKSVDPYSQHLIWLERWENSGRKSPPPFTGLLCVLSLAAEKMRSDSRFSSSNYYHRLLEVLGIEQHNIRIKLTQNAKSTLRFWRALNLWLSECDFEMGRPTARQVNSWKYVSFAISQALVRDADRASFHQLFEKLGLSSHDEVTEGEMALYIHEWMATQGPSSWLRRIWSVNDLHDRVITAALTELEAWDQDERNNMSETGASSRKLSWVAVMAGFPRKSLRLWLCASGSETSRVDGLRPISPISAATKEALPESTERFVLSSLDVGDLLALGPPNAINIAPLMHAYFELEAEGHKHRFAHVPKPVIPLAKSENGPFYREVARVSLLKEHLVLCHENWTEAVQKFLETNASPGFFSVGSGQLQGIPPGWVLFRGVIIASSPSRVLDNLAPLAPIAGGATIQFSDGLRLGAGIWHSEAPPRVAAVLEEEEFDLLISREAIDDESSQIFMRSKTHAVSICLSALESRDSGNFRVAIVRGKNEKAEKAISFRSAKTPRPLSSEITAYLLEEGDFRWALSAVRLEAATEHVLQGFRLPLDHTTSAVDEEPCPIDLIRYMAEIGQEPQEEMLPTFNSGSFQPTAESCVIRGYHHWIVEPFEKGDSRWDAKRMKCKNCHISTITRCQARSRGKLEKKNLQFLNTRQHEISMQPESSAAVASDVVLDALCYLGHGSWATFQSIAATRREELWYPHTLAQLLVGLGHLDLELDLNTMRPKRWQVSPPALVETSKHGIWFLAGFRSAALVEQITEALTNLGGERLHYEPDSELSEYVWHLGSVQSPAGVINGLSDPLGREILVVERAAERLIAALPNLEDLRDALPKVHMESPPDLQVFDVRSGKWRDTSTSLSPGAYRSSYGACRYFYRGEDGSARGGTADLVKRFAACGMRVAIDEYNRDTRTFSTVLGCEPPSLFSRALVACSGRAPKRENGRSFYADVPPEIAHILFSKLYGQSK